MRARQGSQGETKGGIRAALVALRGGAEFCHRRIEFAAGTEQEKVTFECGEFKTLADPLKGRRCRQILLSQREGLVAELKGATPLGRDAGVIFKWHPQHVQRRDQVTLIGFRPTSEVHRNRVSDGQRHGKVTEGFENAPVTASVSRTLSAPSTCTRTRYWPANMPR